MSEFVLSLGSNCLDKERNITQAFEWVKSISTSSVFSDIYVTKALNGKDADYANAVCSCMIDISYEELNILLKEFEKDNGRTPESKILGIIPIDLDIVLMDGNIMRPKDYAQDYFQKGWKMIK